MTFSSPTSPPSFHENTMGFHNTQVQDVRQAQVSVSTSKRAARGPHQCLRHYERQKLEKEALELEIFELTRQLQEAQARKQDEGRAHKRQRLLTSAPVWQAWVSRELNGRLAAEAQRTWLKAAIAGKIALAEDLKATVRQHMKIASLVEAQTQGRSSGLFLEPTDELLYAMDIRDACDLYQQTDEIFRTSGLDPMSEVEDFHRTLTTGDNGVSIRYAWKQRLMFNFEQTCRAMWMMSHQLHRQEDRVAFDGNPDLDNILAVKFRITNRLAGGEKASLRQRLVTRRFIEDGRMILAWKSFLAGEGPCSGMQIDESGWTILRPSTSGSGTVVEVCMHQVPLHLNSPAPESTTNKFNDLLQSMIQENSREVFKALEAVLLEDVLTGISVKNVDIF